MSNARVKLPSAKVSVTKFLNAEAS